MKATFDEDGYPTYETLNNICNFKFKDKNSAFEFFDYCKSAFNNHYGSWQVIKDFKDLSSFNKDLDYALRISTGGWSGNEMIISAMEKNMIWHFYWIASFRGGLHILDYSRVMHNLAAIDQA